MGKKKSEFLASLGVLWEIWKALVNEVLDQGGSDDDLRRIQTDANLRRQIAGIIVGGRSQPVTVPAFFLPLLDSQVPSLRHSTLAKYRAEATRQNIPVTTPLCYRVVNGFTLKTHAPKAGPCRENFQYLQNWNFEDKPTTDCLVFWIPRLVPGSTAKTVDEQKTLLAEFRNRLDLPKHHCSSFGSVALLSGLILAHQKATEEQVPLNGLWTRTDSCNSGGHRLVLFWDSGDLCCGDWDWNGDRDDYLGVFALGVETLGS